jgi:hypothetical protein
MRISMTAAAAVGVVVASAGCGGGGGTGTGGASSASASATTGTGQGGASGSTTSSATTGTTGSGGMTTGTTGSVSSTGTGPCIPKTCLTLAVEIAGDAGVNDQMPDACGILSDGCANFIDCGGCASSDQACGAGYPTPNGGAQQPGVPHLCGGGCTLQSDDGGNCSSYPGYKLYYCTNKTNNAPMALVFQCQSPIVGPSPMWCCP